jgi:hypothetical protein
MGGGLWFGGQCFKYYEAKLLFASFFREILGDGWLGLPRYSFRRGPSHSRDSHDNVMVRCVMVAGLASSIIANCTHPLALYLLSY